MKVISGGQTGIDQLGLETARLLGIETGGTAPLGYMTEEGSNLELRDKYGLDEHTSSNYPPRTEKNIVDSDLTVLFGNMKSPGSLQTITLCKKMGKAYIINPDGDRLKRSMEAHKVKTLNVAGNRLSKLNREQVAQYGIALMEGLAEYIGLEMKHFAVEIGLGTSWQRIKPVIKAYNKSHASALARKTGSCSQIDQIMSVNECEIVTKS